MQVSLLLVACRSTAGEGQNCLHACRQHRGVNKLTHPCQGSNLRQLTVLKSAVVLMQT